MTVSCVCYYVVSGISTFVSDVYVLLCVHDCIVLTFHVSLSYLWEKNVHFHNKLTCTCILLYISWPTSYGTTMTYTIIR